ncbi:MAG: recombinase family protein [Anaerotignum sp.]
MARKSRKHMQLHIQQETERSVYRVAIYARISVDNKEDTNMSVENQIMICKKKLEEYHDLHFVEAYIDQGQTGTNFNRPAFSRLMEDIREGNINCVIVKDLSRFGRNYLETGYYLEYVFPYLGVRFLSVNDDFDSNLVDGNDALLLSLKGILHENYAKDISRKVSSAIDIKKKSGKFMNRIPPYGYVVSQKDKYQLEIHTEQSEVIRLIFHWRLEGMGPSLIAKKLNDMKVLTLRNYRYFLGYADGKKESTWHGSTIVNILQNPCYLGCLVERKTQKWLYQGGVFEKIHPSCWNIIKHTHEPIIDEEIFYKVQTLQRG